MIFFEDGDHPHQRKSELQEVDDPVLVDNIRKHFEKKNINKNQPIIIGSFLESNTCNDHTSLEHKPIGLEF